MTTTLKTCFKCGVAKPRSEFYRHQMMSDGLLGKCKECAKRDTHENRVRNIDYYRQYDVMRAKTQERMTRAAKVTREWRARDSRHMAAHSAVALAVRSGVLVKKPCERCGRSDVHAHHEDYSKPLSVIWLCPACHRNRHNELAAIATSAQVA